MLALGYKNAATQPGHFVSDRSTRRKYELTIVGGSSRQRLNSVRIRHVSVGESRAVDVVSIIIACAEKQSVNVRGIVYSYDTCHWAYSVGPEAMLVLVEVTVVFTPTVVPANAVTMVVTVL